VGASLITLACKSGNAILQRHFELKATAAAWRDCRHLAIVLLRTANETRIRVHIFVVEMAALAFLLEVKRDHPKSMPFGERCFDGPRCTG
jgi:hypothetical protein